MQKLLIKITLIVLSFLLVSSCKTQNMINYRTVNNLVEKGEFVFMVRRINPSDIAVVNILNVFSLGGIETLLNSSDGYTLVVKSGKVMADLPYFGRMYNPSFDIEKNGIKFTSEEFEIQKITSKKGVSIFNIWTKDVQHIRLVVVEIHKSGQAWVSVHADDRSPISYSGYITE